MQDYIYNGQVYPTINQLSQATNINGRRLTKMLAPFSETEGRIDVTQLIDDYLKKRANPTEYVYKGQVYPSINKLAKATFISSDMLSKMLKQLPEKEGRIVVDQLLDEYFRSQNWNLKYQGVSYLTPQDAAKSLGISYHILMNHLRNTDYDLEKAMELFGKYPIIAVFDGKEYTNKVEIAMSLGVDVDTFDANLAHEGSIEAAYDAIKDKKEQVLYIWNGEEYYTIKDLAKALKVDYNALCKSLRKENNDLERAIERLRGDRMNSNTYQYQGNTYHSKTEAAKALKVNYTELLKFLHEANNDLEKAILLLERSHSYQYQGIAYDSIEAAADAIGVNRYRLSDCLREADHDLEKAMDLLTNDPRYMPKRVFIYKGKPYRTIKKLAKITNIPESNLRYVLNRHPVKEGRIEVDQLLEEYIRTRDERENQKYHYDGIYFDSVEEAAKALKINYDDLRKFLREADNDLEKAVELWEIDLCYIPKEKVYVYKGQAYQSINELAKATNISSKQLDKMFKQFAKTEGRIVVDQLIDRYLSEQSQKYRYKENFYSSIEEAAEALGLGEETLRRYLGEANDDLEKAMELYEKRNTIAVNDDKKYTNKEDIAKAAGVSYENLKEHTLLGDENAQKALLMIKAKDSTKTIRTKSGKELNITDLAAVLGVKQMILKSYLDRRMTIGQIKEHANDQNSNISIRGYKMALQLGNAKEVVLEYCVENKLSFNCIYNMITEYGKSISEAINHYCMNGQEIPKSWIHERYDNLLKHVILDEKIDYQKVINVMRTNPMPIREALEYVMVRDAAIEKSFDPEWQHEIYSAYTDPSLSEEERQECVKAFYITPEEIKAIEECKEKVDRLERKLDLYEIAECIRDRVFTDAEIAGMMKVYKISDQELKTILTDFYIDLKVRAEEMDIRLKNDIELKRCVTEVLDRYAKLTCHVQDDEKEETESSKSSDENPDL